MAETDVAALMDAVPLLIEQLSKALSELESHEDASINKAQLMEILEHFRQLEAMMLRKYLDLDIREKAFCEQESVSQDLISSQEADVVRKEQDMLDRIQKLKDAAASAIAEACENHKLTPFEHVDAGDSEDSQVSSSLGDSNVFHSGSEVKSSHGTGEKAGVVKPRPELMQICEQMDAKGLLNFIMENQKNITLICSELALALQCAAEPGCLVLASLEGFYPPDEPSENGEKKTDIIQDIRRSCLVCIKAMATYLAMADQGSDCTLSPEIMQQAKSIADEWKPKMANAAICSASENSLETEAFLQLLATFRISSEFDEEELCKLVLAGAHKRPGPELCRSLGLTHRISGVVQALINRGKEIDAAHFIHAFQLTESFPIAPILKAHLKDLRRSLQGKGASSGNAETNANAQELAALKGIVECIQDYGLEEEYPLDPLQRRIAQLECSKTYNISLNKKRYAESQGRQLNPNKKPNTNGVSASTPRYPPLAHDSQTPTPHAQQEYDPRSHHNYYHHPADEKVASTLHSSATAFSHGVGK
ncbi:hypothetical protein DM860_008117 [Cuscuta australis]|uniref:FRIGIDA-like protein n=2 Tax=Cuscuta sect. Cleistogrammica TaxID=1824901 RepID=A0A328D2F3_9ASTE|nr:hypothetical protein DM860_008117 [Cuscuta australis]